MGYDLIYTKAAGTVEDVDEKERTVTSKITTDRVDSDLEVVLTKGLDWSRHLKNRIVLFMHDMFCPIGKCLWHKPKAREVVAKTRFAEDDFAEKVFQLYAQGFMKAWSLGMDPMTAKRREITPADVRKRSDWAGARAIVESAQVAEYSAVTIPANEDALNRAFATKAFGIVEDRLEGLKALERRVKAVERRVIQVRVVKPKRIVKPRPVGLADVAAIAQQELRKMRGLV
jgi:hypothetical protein